MKRIILILLAAGLWHSSASAEDYYWIRMGTGVPYSSPALACQHQTTAIFTKVVINADGISGSCYFDMSSIGLGELIQGGVERRGDTCPPETTYNPTTGECVAPEPDACESTNNKVITHEYNGGPVDRPGPPDPPPSAICEGQCQYSRTDVVKGCARFLYGDNLTDVFCTVEYKGNGSSCTSGNPPAGSVFDQPPSKPPSKTDPTFKEDRKCGPWETAPDGTQTRSCSSSTESKRPGKVDCTGESCKAGTPPPDYTKVVQTQDTTKTTNPDGSSTTKTETTTETTNCKGVKPCTVTGKDEVGTDEEGAGDEGGDSTYECTGTGCDSSGEDEEEQKGSVSGESCDATVSCEGDAVQCAVLRQQKEMRCHAEEQADFESKKSDIEGLFEGEKFQLDQTEIAAEGFINTAGRFLPANGCPSPENMNLRLNGGRSFELNYEPLCQAASDLSWLIVSIASLLAALYVGRSFGGS